MKALRIISAFFGGIGLAVLVWGWPTWQRALAALSSEAAKAWEWLVYG